MKTSQFIALLLVIVIGQVVGFGVVAKAVQPSVAEADLLAIHAEIRNAIAELRAAQDSIGQDMGSAAIALPEAGALRQAIRAVLESELRSRVATGSSGTTAQHSGNVVATGPSREVDPAVRQAAANESNAIIQRALGARRWTAADSSAILPHLDALDEMQRIRLAEQFHRALERHELTLERGAMPPM